MLKAKDSMEVQIIPLRTQIKLLKNATANNEDFYKIRHFTPSNSDRKYPKLY